MFTFLKSVNYTTITLFLGKLHPLKSPIYGASLSLCHGIYLTVRTGIFGVNPIEMHQVMVERVKVMF